MAFWGSGWRFDPTSFWIGAGLMAASAALLFRFRQPLTSALAHLRASYNQARGSTAASAGERQRAQLIRWAQTSHLAAPLFLLQEILIPPRCLLPPPAVDPLQPAEDDSVPSLALTPDWPELWALYRGPTCLLTGALRVGGHLLITGAPGSGRSTALAAIALNYLAPAATAAGSGSPSPTAILCAHALDLDLGAPTRAAEATLLAALSQGVPGGARSPTAHFKRALESERPLLLLDGLDELPPEQCSQLRAWMGELLSTCPRLQVIAAAGLDEAPLWSELGFLALTLSPWRGQECRAFIDRWCARWAEFVADTNGKSRWPDAEVIAGWLSAHLDCATPLEMTLRVWSACARDSQGASFASDVDALIARQVSPHLLTGLQRAAFKMVTGSLPALGRREIESTTAPAGGGEADRRPSISSEDLRGLLERRVMCTHAGEHVAFGHLALCARLAARAPRSETTAAEFAVLPCSPAADLTAEFMADQVDLAPLLKARLAPPSSAPSASQPAPSAPSAVASVQEAAALIECATWARMIGAAPEWRADLLRRLAGLLRASESPYRLRSRALAALIATRDPGLGVLFHQMLASRVDGEGVALAALGCGAIRDYAVIDSLAKLLGSEEPRVHWAAALGLGRMGKKEAAEALGQLLLAGEEEDQRSASVALALDREQGHGLLKEAAADADVAVRRAAVFGLARIEEPWVPALLETMQREDAQWAVKSAAMAALERTKDSATRVPERPPDPSGLPWLIAFAATRGVGVPPGPASIAVLERALGEGKPGERAAAAAALGQVSPPRSTAALARALSDPDALTRDEAFEALWRWRRRHMVR